MNQQKRTKISSHNKHNKKVFFMNYYSQTNQGRKPSYKEHTHKT